MSVDFTGLPNAAESIQFRFTLPDGTSELVTLTATASATPGANEFTIGATAALTAANLQTALTGSIETLANTSLVAASAVVAADNFFNGTPQRVSGPPATATGLVAGTPANTVSWYTGEDGGDPARSTATARADTSISVSYGMRANEEGIRWMVQNVAALAAVTFASGDPDAVARNAALNTRVGTNLAVPPGTQTIEDIQTDLAGAQHTLQAATERHQQTRACSAACWKRSRACRTTSRGRDHRAADPPAGIAADDVAAVPDEFGELPLIFRRRNARGRKRKLPASCVPILAPSVTTAFAQRTDTCARMCVDSAARRRANDQGRCRRDRPGIARDIVAAHRRHGRSPAGRGRCRQGNF